MSDLPDDVPPEFAMAMTPREQERAKRKQRVQDRAFVKANARRKRLGKQPKEPEPFEFSGQQPETGGQAPADPFANRPDIMSEEYPDVGQFVGKLREQARGQTGGGDVAGTLRTLQESMTKVHEKLDKLVEWTEQPHPATFGE